MNWKAHVIREGARGSRILFRLGVRTQLGIQLDFGLGKGKKGQIVPAALDLVYVRHLTTSLDD
jgi:hypothetical protein